MSVYSVHEGDGIAKCGFSVYWWGDAWDEKSGYTIHSLCRWGDIKGGFTIYAVNSREMGHYPLTSRRLF